MSYNLYTFDDQFVKSSLSGLKRDREDEPTDPECAFESAVKKISYTLDQTDGGLFAGVCVPSSIEHILSPQDEILPYPFYHYHDHSTEPDPDPLTPLTPPGRVPNFPAKMQAILSRRDLADIISWMPHGRSWRVLKPREFEVRVIPTYFEHAKFSSFIRQANGWGFRRITQGRDRNSYYHPLFLRGLPHLCKQMKRPGVSEKQTSYPDHEPDLYKISELHPVPEKTDDESIMLLSTIQGGPKARVPIYSGHSLSLDAKVSSSSKIIPKLTPSDQQALAAFEQSLGASENQLSKIKNGSSSLKEMQPVAVAPLNVVSPAPFVRPYTMNAMDGTSPLAIANQLAFAGNFDSNSPAAQFAAGFAAATALSQRKFQEMLASFHNQEAMGKVDVNLSLEPEQSNPLIDFQCDFSLDDLQPNPINYWN